MSGDTPKPLALTCEQVDVLSASIASAVCNYMAGMGHQRSEVQDLAFEVLCGTPYLGDAARVAAEQAEEWRKKANTYEARLCKVVDAAQGGGS